MIKLKIKSYSPILIENYQNYQYYIQVRLINLNFLQMKKYFHLIKVE